MEVYAVARGCCKGQVRDLQTAASGRNLVTQTLLKTRDVVAVDILNSYKNVLKSKIGPHLSSRI